MQSGNNASRSDRPSAQQCQRAIRWGSRPHSPRRREAEASEEAIPARTRVRLSAETQECLGTRLQRLTDRAGSAQEPPRRSQCDRPSPSVGKVSAATRSASLRSLSTYVYCLSRRSARRSDKGGWSAPTATPSSRCSHFGIARGLPPISSLDSGDVSGHGRGTGEVSRAGGEVAAGVRVIVSRARFGGPGF